MDGPIIRQPGLAGAQRGLSVAPIPPADAFGDTGDIVWLDRREVVTPDPVLGALLDAAVAGIFVLGVHEPHVLRARRVADDWTDAQAPTVHLLGHDRETGHPLAQVAVLATLGLAPAPGRAHALLVDPTGDQALAIRLEPGDHGLAVDARVFPRGVGDGMRSLLYVHVAWEPPTRTPPTLPNRGSARLVLVETAQNPTLSVLAWLGRIVRGEPAPERWQGALSGLIDAASPAHRPSRLIHGQLTDAIAGAAAALVARDPWLGIWPAPELTLARLLGYVSWQEHLTTPQVQVLHHLTARPLPPSLREDADLLVAATIARARLGVRLA